MAVASLLSILGSIPAGAVADGAPGIAEDNLIAGMLAAAGVAVLTLVVLVRLRATRRRRAANDARRETEPGRPTLRPRAGGESLEALMVEAQELTRVCAAQMENRAMRLERLLAEADERIAELERLSGGGRPAGRGAPARDARRAPDASRSPEGDPLADRVFELADRGMQPVEIARQLDEHTGKIELILALHRH